MALYTDSINTSVAFKVNSTQVDTELNLRRLSSGKRILRPSDDAGAMQVAMTLDGSRKRSDGALLGLQNARSYSEAQDNALSVAGKIFTRMSELASLALDPMKNTTDRAAYDYEFQELVKEIQKIDLEEFNDVRLFRGTTYNLINNNAALKWSEAKTVVDDLNVKDSINDHYLATITSQSEQDEIARQIGAVGINAWLGGNDTATEGDWRWTEGPEGRENGGAGRQFWSGKSGGSAINGAFENWGSGEPNNSGNEDFLQISQGSTPAGSWNDLPDRDNMGGAYQPTGYVRETDEGALPIYFDGNGSNYGLPTISYTTGKKGDVLYLPGEMFTSMNVKTVANASRAIELISGNQKPGTDGDTFSALTVIADLRAQVGANLSRLSMETENLTRKRDNFEAAHSRTSDLDFALENTRYQANSVRLEYGAAMLAQANNMVTNSLWKNYV
ncbi:MAG: flagellin [Opitutales bacterium]